MVSLYSKIVSLVYILLLKNNFVHAGKRVRIFSGQETYIEKHPWIVSLLHPSDGMHNCGGSLINADTVITAAHCVHNKTSEPVSIIAGTSEWAHPGTIIKIKSISMHENFSTDGRTAKNDIAIIKLAEKVKFSNKIQPIKLPPETTKLSEGTSLTIAGWGQTTIWNSLFGTPTMTLMEAKVTVSKSENERIIITSDRSGSCPGDSGGPLELNGMLVGIVSSGRRYCTDFFPISSSYTNVAFFRTWITEKLEG
ncbi:trypsin alpha-like [Diabrotica virgifera virgifera]|uniref:Peptidase S1 domain-containing protein n=1 Tax=Diabrotica virgifera virgifera TaxID=50390 RepID=A0ABM5JIT8_DIAVI|nr:trypsin alpha-like [Diabrotica virgifera virgifera]